MTSHSPRPLPITVAEPHHRPVLEQLWTMFGHDLSEFSGVLPDAKGRFRQERLDAALADPGWRGYLVTLAASPVGLAVVRGLGSPERVLSSFFIVKGARRCGYGLAAVRSIAERHPGHWAVAFQPSNAAAVTFWRRVAEDISPSDWREEKRQPEGQTAGPPDTWISFNVQ